MSVWATVAWLSVAACGGVNRPTEGIGGDLGLGHYSAVILERFDRDRALATVAFADQFFRLVGNAGYSETLSRVQDELLTGGFDADSVRLRQMGSPRTSWRPVRARLELVGEEEPLHAFEREEDLDRAALLVGSSSLSAREVEVVAAERLASPSDAAGRLVLSRGSPSGLADRYIRGGGALGILVLNLEPFHYRLNDPRVVQFDYLPVSSDRQAVGFSLSPRSFERLQARIDAEGSARVRVEVDVVREMALPEALEAEIPGRHPELGPVVLVAHVDEPGANDNGSGVAALAELARSLRAAIDAGDVATPERPIVFLWGEELAVSQRWLSEAPKRPAAGLVLDMVGEDPAIVGAPFLIERTPDPGAIWTRPPDAQTEWGGGAVSVDALWGHFLNDYALRAVSVVAEQVGGWEAGSNPYAGGSDHVSFLDRRIPSVLAWHFTDEAYHTNLDRLDRVSGEEMRRVAAVMGAVALGLASGDERDAAEMLGAVEAAAVQRIDAIESDALPRLAACATLEVERRIARAWLDWYGEAVASVVETSPELDSQAERVRSELDASGRWLLDQMDVAASGARSQGGPCRLK